MKHAAFAPYDKRKKMRVLQRSRFCTTFPAKVSETLWRQVLGTLLLIIKDLQKMLFQGLGVSNRRCKSWFSATPAPSFHLPKISPCMFSQLISTLRPNGNLLCYNAPADGVLHRENQCDRSFYWHTMNRPGWHKLFSHVLLH